MGKLFKFKSIKAKVLTGFIIVLLIVLIMSVLNYLGVKRISDSSNAITQKELPILIQDESLSYNMLELESLARGYFLYGDADLKNQFYDVIDEGEEIGKTILELSASEKAKEHLDRKKAWQNQMIEAINLYDQGKKQLAADKVNAQKDTYTNLINDINDLTVSREENIIEKGNDSHYIAKTTTIFIVSLSIFVIVLGIVIGLITSRTISKPIVAVMDRMNEVAKGRLDMDELEVKTHDETAQLTYAINQMSANNRQLLQQIKNVAEIVSTQSEELTQSANEVKAATEQVAVTMQELAAGAEIQANSASDLTNVMGDFTNKLVNANDQSSQVETSSKEVAEMTEDGKSFMRNSSKQMNTINQLVHDSVEKMQHLDQQSQAIGKLVVVINDIAEQTNLLALNAAIEAARAGENGRGFAVVADEVRKLAEQVGHSIKDITTIVSSIQEESKTVSTALEKGFHEVEQGTELIQTTEDTFEKISGKMNDMTQKIKEVSTHLTGVVASNEQMGSSIEEIASVSEEAAAGVEQTAASAEQASSSMDEVADNSTDLAKVAEELNQLVSKYKV